jgi:hypothetical protein
LRFNEGKGLKGWSFLMVLEQEASTCGALLMVKIQVMLMFET